MQPWARRGCHPALVTGGMRAAGPGVASNLTSSQDRRSRPTRVPFASDDALDFGGFPADLFSGGPASGAAPALRRLSGTLDPMREMLPRAEQAEEVTGRHRLAPTPRRMELAGWVIDTGQPGVPGADPRSSGGNPAEIGTPSEGFHRSLSWTGAVGTGAMTDRLPVERALVVPTDDPAVVTSFGDAGSIVELWEGRVGHGTSEVAGLVVPDAVDLTAGTVAEPPSNVYTVPRELVDATLSTDIAPPPRRHEFLPLTVPGEYQERANEVPKLSDLVDGDRLTTSAVPRHPDPEETTVPLFGGSAPNKITAALGDSPASDWLAMPRSASATTPMTTLTRA